jgi:hypothetical protein
MIFLYLDESGDLGFDFVNKRPSKYFVVTVLAYKGMMRTGNSSMPSRRPSGGS